jgi:2-hydroxychromene-2-carboxylate isomerase
VAVAGLEEGWGEEFSRKVYRAQFAECRQVGDRNVIGEIVDALGQNGAAALVRAGSDDIKQKLRRNTAEAQQHGIFGAPSFIARGELFWGNDRLEQALRAARD